MQQFYEAVRFDCQTEAPAVAGATGMDAIAGSQRLNAWPGKGPSVTHKSPLDYD